MLDRNQIVDLLKVIVAYDGRSPGEADVLAWGEAANRGRWTFDGALDAIHDHYAFKTDWIKPGHVTEHIRSRRALPPRHTVHAIESRPPSDPRHVKRLMAEVRAQLNSKKGKDADG